MVLVLNMPIIFNDSFKVIDFKKKGNLSVEANGDFSLLFFDLNISKMDYFNWCGPSELEAKF